MKIVLATGGFDPLHSGHIAYFKHAATLGDRLIVGLNSDAWLTRKKGRAFMPINERLSVIGNLAMVDNARPFNDDTNNSTRCIYDLLEQYPDDEIVFVNGGDRDHTNVPEQDEFANEPRVSFVFGVGGNDKQNSSRWILEEWKAPKTDRPWGHYRVIYQPDKNFKAKELVVKPGSSLSMQRHEHRSEHWFIAEGYATIYTIEDDTETLVGVFGKHQSISIPKDKWHRLANETDTVLKLIELQYGDICVETDIIRR
jgi:cytidyltransferase-like protein